MSQARRYRIAVAAPEAVEQFAADLPEAFLLCRELGHTWRPHTARIVSRRYYERQLRCGRCHTIREEELSMTGEVLRRHMTYADGYLAHNIGRIVGDGRGQLRVASITRQMGVTPIRRSARSRARKAS